MALDIKKPIPVVEFPNVQKFEVEPVDEKIVSLSKAGFMCASAYYSDCLMGSLKDCYARETVVKMLKEAESKLPNGYKFLILDAYRPIKVQQSLWDDYRAKIVKENPEKNDEEIDFLTSHFITKPSYDEMMPSLHNTGGAVDLTIVDKNGHVINMGTKFDEFSDPANTHYFEVHNENTEVRDNRRMLYNIMLDTGFTNLPTEWWHYGYGTKFWAYFKGKKAFYKGMLEFDEK